MRDDYGAPKPRGQIDTGSATTDPLEVVEIFNELCFQHRLDDAFERCLSPDLIVHDPAVKGGDRQGLYEMMRGFGLDQPIETSSAYPLLVVDRQFASGPFVTVMHHIKLSAEDRGALYVDVIHVKDGKIDEFWTVHLAAPESSENPHTLW